MKKVQELRNKQKGATVIEYALIAALIAVVAIGAMTLIGDNVKSTFSEVGDKLGAAGTGGN